MSDVPRTKAAKKRTVTSKAMLAVIDQLQKLFLKNINGVMLHTSRTLNLANMQSASNADLYVKLITSPQPKGDCIPAHLCFDSTSRYKGGIEMLV